MRNDMAFSVADLDRFLPLGVPGGCKNGTFQFPWFLHQPPLGKLGG